MPQLVKTILDRTERFLQTDLRYILRGGGWLTLGQGVSTLLSLLVAVAFSHYFSKEEYGTYKYILSIVGLLSITTLGNMTYAIAQSVARGNSGAYMLAIREKQRWGMLGALGGILLGCYYLFIGDNIILGTGLIFFSPLIPFIESYGLFGAVYNGKKLFRDGVLRNSLIQSATSAVVIIMLATTGNIVLTLLAYGVTYATVRYVVHRRMMKEFQELSTTSDPEHAIDFGRKLSLVGIMPTIADQLDTILLWHFFGASDAASFAFAMATTTPAKTYMKSIAYLAFPKFSEKSSASLKQTINKKVWKSMLLFVPFTVVYIAVLPLLYDIFFPTYLDTVHYAQVLGLMFLFFPFKLYSIALTTRLDRKPIYLMNTYAPILSAVLLVICIPMFGVWGSIGVQLLEFAIMSVVSYLYFRNMKDESAERTDERGGTQSVP